MMYLNKTLGIKIRGHEGVNKIAGFDNVDFKAEAEGK